MLENFKLVPGKIGAIADNGLPYYTFTASSTCKDLALREVFNNLTAYFSGRKLLFFRCLEQTDFELYTTITLRVG